MSTNWKRFVWLYETCRTRQLFFSGTLLTSSVVWPLNASKKEQSFRIVGQIQVVTFLLNARDYYLVKKGNYYLFICQMVLRMSNINKLGKFYFWMTKIRLSCYFNGSDKSYPEKSTTNVPVIWFLWYKFPISTVSVFFLNVKVLFSEPVNRSENWTKLRIRSFWILCWKSFSAIFFFQVKVNSS